MGEVGRREQDRHHAGIPEFGCHQSIIIYETSDDNVQVIRGYKDEFEKELSSTHEIKNHLINVSESKEKEIIIKEFGDAHDKVLFGILGKVPHTDHVKLFLSVLAEPYPLLLVAPKNATVNEVTERVILSAESREDEDNSEIVLLLDGKPLVSGTLADAGIQPLEMVQVVVKEEVTMRFDFNEEWDKRTKHNVPVSNSASAGEIKVQVARELTAAGVSFDSNSHSLHISSGFSCLGDNDLPALDVVDRHGNYLSKKMTTVRLLLHQSANGEETVPLRLRYQDKQNAQIDSVVMMPLDSSMDDLRREMGKQLCKPGNSLRIKVGVEGRTLLLPHSILLSHHFDWFKPNERDAPILYVEWKADLQLTVAIAIGPLATGNASMNFTVQAQRYDPAVVVYRNVAERRNCDPGLVHVSFNGKALSDHALLRQCGVQDGCELTAIIHEEGTTLRLRHKGGPCCTLLVKNAAVSTVADVEQLVEEIQWIP